MSVEKQPTTVKPPVAFSRAADLLVASINRRLFEGGTLPIRFAQLHYPVSKAMLISLGLRMIEELLGEKKK